MFYYKLNNILIQELLLLTLLKELTYMAYWNVIEKAEILSNDPK